MVHATRKNDAGKGMENDRGTTLKIVGREDFSEEAICPQKPEWIRDIVIWI